MKRFLSFLFIFACLLTLLIPTPAAADAPVALKENDGASYYTIHAKAPGENRPSLYAWNSAGDHMEWPGEKMNRDGEWCTLQVPTHYEYFRIVGSTYYYTDEIKIPSGGNEFWVTCDMGWSHTITDKAPEPAHPTTKLHIYAPEAKRIQVDIWSIDRLQIRDFEDRIHLSPSEKEGWWECEIYTDLQFTINGDLECLSEHPMGILKFEEETWIVVDENGDHQISKEEPHIPEPENEDEDTQPPVILFVFIGIGAVVLVGAALAVVLIIHKKR